MKTFIVALLVLCQSLVAQNQQLDLSADPYNSVWEVEAQNWMSPVTTPAVWILGVGSVLTWAIYDQKKKTDGIEFSEELKREGEEREKKGSWQYYGNLIGWGMLQGAYTLTQLPGILNNDERALENTEMMWKSTLYTSLTTGIMKLAIKEERQTSEGKFESFPSGHASAAFAFATNIALRHEWYWSLVSAPFVIMASTSRVSTHAHYVHDAVFGAALGMSFAYGMNYLAEEGEVPYLLGFEPMDDGGGIHFKYQF